MGIQGPQLDAHLIVFLQSLKTIGKCIFSRANFLPLQSFQKSIHFDRVLRMQHIASINWLFGYMVVRTLFELGVWLSQQACLNCFLGAWIIALIQNNPILSNLSARPGFSLLNLGSLSSKENEFKISISFRQSPPLTFFKISRWTWFFKGGAT